MLTPAKNTPGEVPLSGGISLGTDLLPFAVSMMPVKSLADVIGNYARCDRRQKPD